MADIYVVFTMIYVVFTMIYDLCFNIYVVFTMILCALRSLEMLITLLSKLMWVPNQKLVLSEAIWS